MNIDPGLKAYMNNGGLFGQIGDWIGSINGQNKVNQINKNIADENLAFQREANERNLAYQREANVQNIAFQREINDLNYYRQLEENNLTREREDNAVRRAMADVTGAGLSKTLATGLSANSASMNVAKAESPVYDKLSQQALRNEYQYQNQLRNLDLIGTATSIYKTLSEGMVNKATAENLASSTGYNEMRTSHYVEEMTPRIAETLARTNLTKQQKKMLEQEFGINEYDFGKMFDLGFTSKGLSPSHIANTNALEEEKLKGEIDLTKAKLWQTRTNNILEPVLDLLKIFVLPSKLGLKNVRAII